MTKRREENSSKMKVLFFFVMETEIQITGQQVKLS